MTVNWGEWGAMVVEDWRGLGVVHGAADRAALRAHVGLRFGPEQHYCSRTMLGPNGSYVLLESTKAPWKSVAPWLHIRPAHNTRTRATLHHSTPATLFPVFHSWGGHPASPPHTLAHSLSAAVNPLVTDSIRGGSGLAPGVLVACSWGAPDLLLPPGGRHLGG